jgi:cell wall-associated NlpC family hydrolase
MTSSRRLVAAAVLTLSPLLAAVPLAPAAAAPTPTTAASISSASHRQIVHQLRKQVVNVAKSKINARYVWGGSGPDSFDCSGLVMWVYSQVTGTQLPHYSGGQMDVTRPVTGRLRKGDLLFYGPDGSQHVALYIGRGMQIGANNPRSGIVVDSIEGSYWAQRYVGAGRVIR